MNLLEEISFRIQVTGDKTGEQWVGDFTCLKRLSHRLELTRDRLEREFLGPNPEGASTRAKSQAETFADLKVCLVKAPTWWTESGFGLDLVDDNLISEIWNETIKIRASAIEEIQKKAEEAEAKLKQA